MEYFTIQNFRPIEAKESATDQDRSVLRVCEGVLPYPQGALCAGPRWNVLGGQTNLRAAIEAALAGASNTKAHFVSVTKSGVTFLVVWSLTENRALGAACVVGATAPDLDSAGVTIAAPAGAPWRDKDPSAEWFASPVGGRFIFGNGKDENLIWEAGALRFLGPTSEPEDPNLRSRVRIPPCRVFRQHVNLSLFAAGNLTGNPLRVWITEAPNQREGFLEGVYSLATSYIDVQQHGGATEIRALSVFQQYVTVHTDAKPVNLFGVDSRGNGWKCDQSASAANASAINPNCVGDVFGDASFYLGRDLEIYVDQAVRSGPFEKRAARAQEIVTEQGAGTWNKSVKQPLQATGYHTFYDRTMRLFWMWMPNKFDARPSLWVYNERTRSVSGPIRYPSAAVSAAIPGPAGSLVAVITQAGEFLYANLADIGEREPESMEPASTALGADYAAVTPAPTPTAGMPVVGLDVSGAFPKFLESVGTNHVGLSDVFGPVATINPAGLNISQYFKDAYLARFEFPLLDLGMPGVFKNFLEVRLTLERNSRAYIGIFAETDAGRKGGKWRGLVFPREEVRIPLNLFGQALRVRVVAIVFNAGRFLVRDAKIGYTVGGAD